ncbi:NAD(P)/FAD-dependent oxidoreductase [Streptomyces halobius]|uniref:FAD-dependent oxidoreductase n=1 Tax=Streptomyces halobius TaxID=2879846 RepID=A0ABY4MGN5_9ACTN|nr:FAD-dependent oxidoreductase [Streptomyces halobius]UQA96825.1 FAD-dependent oxidoreductase [Streptomyces halobius]
MRTVTVVGASLAGLYAARALRAQGFDGRLVVIGAERHRPYDRPPLSKDFLARAPGAPAMAAGARSPSDADTLALSDADAVTLSDAEALSLSDADEDAELAAEWLLGTPAAGLDTAGRAVLLADGRRITTDGVVIATGATPRTLPGPPRAGVHTLRTLDDAVALRAELHAGARKVVVIGGGFIGAEAASTCAELGADVTIVEAAPLPLVPQLGREIAQVCARLHTGHGVRLLCGTGVKALRADGRGDGDRGDSGAPPGTTTRRAPRVTGVELADGRLLGADTVIVGIGVRPATDWLAASPLALRDGVLCDQGGVTALRQVVAAGDVARYGELRAEHWTSATEQPAVAVRNLLAGTTVARHTAPPYFWSDQYGSRIQLAGHRGPKDTVRIAEGSPEEGSLLAVYERDGEITAAFALNRPRPFTRLRRRLGAGRPAAPAAPAGAPAAAPGATP